MNDFLTVETKYQSRSLVVLLLVLMLSACATTGGLEPQNSPLDAKALHPQQSLMPVALAQTSWPDGDWWRGLGDRQLDALIVEGLGNSPTLAAADARFRQAQAQAGAQAAERKPSVSASAGYTGLQLPESEVGSAIGGHYSGSAKVSLNFGYELDLWGGKRAAWEAAVDQAHASQIDAQAARLALSVAIAETYVQLGYAWQLYDVAGCELQRAQKILELTLQRRRAGIDSDLQVRQAQAQIPAARQQQQAAQQQIDAMRTALAALLGQGPDRGLQINRPELIATAALQLPQVLPSDLLGRRPDVLAARWRVEAASKQIAAAKSRFYPSLNLSALAGVVNQDVGELFEHASLFGVVAPALSLPLFDGGRLRAGLAAKNAQYDLAVADYNQKVLDALREVVDQVNASRTLQARVHEQQAMLLSENAALELAQSRYRAGIGNYLQVLSVQQQLLIAQQTMATLQTQQILAAVRLRRALGGDLAVESDATTAP